MPDTSCKIYSYVARYEEHVDDADDSDPDDRGDDMINLGHENLGADELNAGLSRSVYCNEQRIL